MDEIERPEKYSCVRGYLPNSKVEYLQVLPTYEDLDFSEDSEEEKNSKSKVGGTFVNSSVNIKKAKLNENITKKQVTFSEKTEDIKVNIKKPASNVSHSSALGSNNLLNKHPNKHKKIHIEKYSCVQGYLPNSQVEYLQVLPTYEDLEVEDDDEDVDGHTGRMLDSRMGGTNATYTGTSFMKSRTSQDNTSKTPGIFQDMAMPTPDKSFSCEHCGLIFASFSHLNRHKKIHTGEKPHICDVCGVGFAQGEHLKDHKRMHTGEKPFKCDVCDINFTSNRSLKNHQRIHTGEKPFTCDICGTGFAQSSNLTRHKRIHLGEKPHACEECGERFARFEHVKAHQRTHTGEKPYKCEECGDSFTSCTSLKHHKKKSHTG